MLRMKRFKTAAMTMAAAIAVTAVLSGCSTVSDLGSSRSMINYDETYGLGSGEYTIMLNSGLLNDKAIDDGNGNVYVALSTINANLTSRFYLDKESGHVLYTKPAYIEEFTPGESTYLAGTETVEADIPVVIAQDGKIYVSLDYMTENLKLTASVYTEPNRLVLCTRWASQDQATTTKKTAIRYQGGTKSEILKKTESGEKLVVLDDGSGDKWAQVATEDGYLGWILNSDIAIEEDVKVEAPEFDLPEYTSLTMDTKVDLLWHGVYSQYNNENVDIVLNDAAGVNVISPRWFTIDNTAGDLISLADLNYVDKCHAAGVKVWAMISNEFTLADGGANFDADKTSELLSSRTARTHIIDQLMSAVDTYGIDGINLDFEMVDKTDAEDYIQFVRELSVALRNKGKFFSIDNYVPMYWAHYNHREEGVFADYIIIMGYDEYHSGSDTAGPVASMSFARQGIEDMLKMVPKTKVINGIPLYTRVWSTDGSGNVSSFESNMNDALGYLTNHGVTPTYDEATGLNYGEYVSENDGNRYQIWLENEFSIKARLEMINEYDLAGVASWCYGYESGPEIYRLIGSMIGTFSGSVEAENQETQETPAEPAEENSEQGAEEEAGSGEEEWSEGEAQEWREEGSEE